MFSVGSRYFSFLQILFGLSLLSRDELSTKHSKQGWDKQDKTYKNELVLKESIWRTKCGGMYCTHACCSAWKGIWSRFGQNFCFGRNLKAERMHFGASIPLSRVRNASEMHFLCLPFSTLGYILTITMLSLQFKLQFPEYIIWQMCVVCAKCLQYIFYLAFW